MEILIFTTLFRADRRNAAPFFVKSRKLTHVRKTRHIRQKRYGNVRHIIVGDINFYIIIFKAEVLVRAERAFVRH